MNGKRLIALVMAGTAACTVALADQPDSPGDVQAADVIAAREALMMAIEDRMQPIDTYTVDDSVDPDLMR